MDKVRTLLEQYLTIDCKQVVVSGRRKSGEVSRIKVRPVMIKDTLCFQKTAFVGKQVMHENLTKEEVIMQIVKLLQEEFKQLQLVHREKTFTVLVNKKGKALVREAR